MKNILLSLTAAASLTIAVTHAKADLGATKDDAIGWWGQPVSVNGATSTYKYNSIVIMETYNSADRAIVTNYFVHEPMSYDIVRLLDKRNLPYGLPASAWTEVKTKGYRTWVTAKGDYIVMAGQEDKDLFYRFYMTDEGFRAMDAMKDNKPEAKTDAKPDVKPDAKSDANIKSSV
jgi:hypothetical protein